MATEQRRTLRVELGEGKVIGGRIEKEEVMGISPHILMRLAFKRGNSGEIYEVTTRSAEPYVRNGERHEQGKVLLPLDRDEYVAADNLYIADYMPVGRQSDDRVIPFSQALSGFITRMQEENDGLAADHSTAYRQAVVWHTRLRGVLQSLDAIEGVDRYEEEKRRKVFPYSPVAIEEFGHMLNKNAHLEGVDEEFRYGLIQHGIHCLYAFRSICDGASNGTFQLEQQLERVGLINPYQRK